MEVHCFSVQMARIDVVWQMLEGPGFARRSGVTTWRSSVTTYKLDTRLGTKVAFLEFKKLFTNMFKTQLLPPTEDTPEYAV